MSKHTRLYVFHLVLVALWLPGAVMAQDAPKRNPDEAVHEHGSKPQTPPGKVQGEVPRASTPGAAHGAPATGRSTDAAPSPSATPPRGAAPAGMPAPVPTRPPVSAAPYTPDRTAPSGSTSRTGRSGAPAELSPAAPVTPTAPAAGFRPAPSAPTPAPAITSPSQGKRPGQPGSRPDYRSPPVAPPPTVHHDGEVDGTNHGYGYVPPHGNLPPPGTRSNIETDRHWHEGHRLPPPSVQFYRPNDPRRWDGNRYHAPLPRYWVAPAPYYVFTPPLIWSTALTLPPWPCVEYLTDDPAIAYYDCDGLWYRWEPYGTRGLYRRLPLPYIANDYPYWPE